MSQVRHFDKRVGITYVYESESYYDREKHQSRSRRKLIGKIDPETGEIVPTGKRGRPPKNPVTIEGTDYESLYRNTLQDVKRLEARVATLEQDLDGAKKDAASCRKAIQKMVDIGKTVGR